MMKWLTAVALLATLAQDPADEASRYQSKAKDNREAVKTRFLGFPLEANVKRPPNAELIKHGNETLASIQGTRDVLRMYKSATTRFGTSEEYGLVRDALYETTLMERGIQLLAGRVSRVDLTPDEVETIDRELPELLREGLANEAEEHFEIEGLSDLLTAHSAKEAKEAIVMGLQKKALKAVNSRLREQLKFDLIPRSNLKAFVRDNARHAARETFKRLLFKVTPNQILVSLAADLILDWVGPKLKEALRNKDDLEERTQRTLDGWEKHRRKLNAFPPDAKVSDVVQAIELAERSFKATKFLDGDIGAAGRSDLITKLESNSAVLQRTIRLAKGRYLLNSPLAQADFDTDIRILDALEKEVRDTLASLPPQGAPATPILVPAPATPAPAPLAGMNGTYTNTPHPEKKDGGHKIQAVVEFRNDQLHLVVTGTNSRTNAGISYAGSLVPDKENRARDKATTWFRGKVARADGSMTGITLEAEQLPGEPYRIKSFMVSEPGQYFFYSFTR